MHGNQSLPYKRKDGKLPYQCNLCPQTCDKLSHFKDHILTHTGKRPVKCHVCDKSFHHNSNLKRHFRLHTGEKPFACDICQERFNRTDLLKLHKQRQHTNERTYKCGSCQKKYASRLRKPWKKSNCEPHSVEEPFSPTDSNGMQILNLINNFHD